MGKGSAGEFRGVFAAGEQRFDISVLVRAFDRRRRNVRGVVDAVTVLELLGAFGLPSIMESPT
ncbi:MULTISPECIES: hypothetical protein [Nocardia]|uniref:hypothetical protein n=1 Tax=Nocardia TaxID=1817 RepID=UPI000687EDC0|nr:MULTISPECIES: hypothetical protein [Nocardia]